MALARNFWAFVGDAATYADLGHPSLACGVEVLSKNLFVVVWAKKRCALSDPKVAVYFSQRS